MRNDNRCRTCSADISDLRAQYAAGGRPPSYCLRCGGDHPGRFRAGYIAALQDMARGFARPLADTPAGGPRLAA